MGMRSPGSGLAVARVHNHDAPLAQVGVHVEVASLGLPALARGHFRPQPALTHAAIHDDPDARIMAELALEILVELRVVPRDDEDLAELHHLFAAASHP